MADRVPVDTLREFAIALFEAAGLAPADSETCADAFLLQEMRGITTHGLRRLRCHLEGLRSGTLNANAKRQVLQESGANVVLDGDHGIGVLNSTEAMDKAIAKTQTEGLGMAVVVNSNHFLGAAP